MGGSSTIASAVEEHLRRDPLAVAVTQQIHGTVAPTEIAANVERALVSIGLNLPVTECTFHTASVGTVTGVVLADGSEVVVKFYQERWHADFLRGVLDVQERLWNNGVPCGRPVGGPVECGPGHATVETCVADPGSPSVLGDEERSASAEGLARVIDHAGTDRRLDSHPLHVEPRADLYPIPHSPLFDFESTESGAEWIDELARLARANMVEAPKVVAHTDWSARNVRLRAEGVIAVYDMDSLASVSVPTALGQAASTWRALGEPGEPIAPDVDEIEDWLDRYPHRLTTRDRTAALAAALWTLCYTARCEHAIDLLEVTHIRARPRLRLDEARFRQALAQSGL